MAEVLANEPLAAEADDWNDEDSALGDGTPSSTTSIGSSILKYRQENGRTYHAYKDGSYLIPNDEDESDRLDHMHHLISLTLDGELLLSPVKRQIHRVLDAGTGTGAWAIDFADEHPEAYVLGIDLSPIQPNFIPPNLAFQIDDIEEPWTYTEKFDLVFVRMLTGALKDWPRLFQQSFDNLNPGGYLEVCDFIYPALTDDDTWPPNSALKKWSDLMLKAMVGFGRPLNSALKYKEQLEAAGFVDVVQREFKWPINRWPKDKKAKELGVWTRDNLAGGALFGISSAVFTRLLGWSLEELEILLIDVRREFSNTKIHAYFPVWVVYGQKPGTNK